MVVASICLYDVLIDFSGIASKSYFRKMDQHKKIRKKMHPLYRESSIGVGIFGSSSTLVTQRNGENTNKVSSL
ncbi:hypothetical protein Peur_074406 [Populus x canadensis]